MSDVRTIASLSRLRNTPDGNPHYRVSFTDGSAVLTKPNAAVVFGITNPEYRGVPCEVQLDHGQLVGLTPVGQRP